MSIRQFEALTQSDIIACEDTRKTGKLLELILERRMKQKFKHTFGVEFETFMDSEQVVTKQEDPLEDQHSFDDD
jgi:16S rRNA C1402 (ribose-2'-O) methylase RsmI